MVHVVATRQTKTRPPCVPDAGLPDTGVNDTGIPDAGPEDAGVTGPVDTGVVDTGMDGGVSDAGEVIVDAGEDAGVLMPWIETVRGPERTTIISVAASESMIVVSGQTNGQISFTGQGDIPMGIGDAFVMALHPDGSHRWTATFQGDGTQTVSKVALGPDDQVYVVGGYTEALNINLPTGPNPTNISRAGMLDENMFFLHLTKDGQFLRNIANGADGTNERLRDILVASDRVYLVGDFETSFAGDLCSSGPVSTPSGSTGSPGVAVFALDANNTQTCIWGAEFTSAAGQLVRGRATAFNMGSQHLYIGGSFTQTLRFVGTGANNILAINDSAGWEEEGFVARLDAATGLALNVVGIGGPAGNAGRDDVFGLAWGRDQLLVTGHFRTNAPHLYTDSTTPVVLPSAPEQALLAVFLQPDLTRDVESYGTWSPLGSVSTFEIDGSLYYSDLNQFAIFGWVKGFLDIPTPQGAQRLPISSENSREAVLAILESNGQFSYHQTFGVPDVPEQGKEMVLLPPYDDEIIGGGFFSGRVNINTFTLEAPSPSTTPVVGQTNRDGFVFRLPYPR